MKIPENLKGHAVKEFRLAIAKLKEQIPFDERLYYYSALFGEIYRVMNIECTPELVFLHHVLNTVHSAFQARLQAMTRNAERPVTLEDSMIEALVSLSESLLDRMVADQDSTDICLRLVNLAYATSGNGYYLYKKGELTL